MIEGDKVKHFISDILPGCMISLKEEIFTSEEGLEAYSLGLASSGTETDKNVGIINMCVCDTNSLIPTL